MRPSTRSVLVLFAAICWVPSAPAAAQTAETSLRITVTDGTGAALVGARAVVQQTNRPEQQVATGPRGDAIVTNLVPGTVGLRVESAGFEAQSITGLRIRPGSNRLDVRLEIARFAVNIDVTRDPREKQTDPRGDAFAWVLSPQQIAQLPDDPEELAKVLAQMAGPGAIMRVDGFGAAGLPPKALIRQIRFSLNAFSADLHEMGLSMIDIITQPGLDTWRLSLNLGFRSKALTARDAFAPAKPSERLRRAAVSLTGPIWRNHTSLSFSTDAMSLVDSKTILASLPGGRFTGVADRPSERFGFSIRLEHTLTKTHTARLELQRSSTTNDTLGVGGVSLPERAHSTTQMEYALRVSDRGSIGKRLFNESRLQVTWQARDTQSLTAKPAVLVLDAFSGGGAQVDTARRSWELEAADNLDFPTGRHALRTGVLVQAGRYRSVDESNRLGTFTFAGLDRYVAGQPTTYARRAGNSLVEYSFARFGWYLQDDVKLHKSLTVGGGVRHELQSQVSGRANLSPRAGVIWSPLPNARLVVRGGAGLFYNWLEASTYEQTLRVDGQREYDVVVISPGYPDPLLGGLPVILPPSRMIAAFDLHLPRITHALVGVQVRIRPLSSVTATVTRQRTQRLFRGRNLNAPGPAGIRLDPDSGNVVQIESTARSSLDRLAVGFSHIVVRSQNPVFLFNVNYILSKEMNDTDGPFSLPMDSHNPAAEWGPAASDVRHRLETLLSVSLPKGLRLLAIASARSAPPYTVTTGFDDNGDTVSNDRPPGVGRNSARGAGQFEVTGRLGWAIGFGKPRGPAGAGQGLSGATSGGDPLGALSRADAQGRRYRLELYVLAYNLLNRVNLIGYRGVQTSPFFGEATASLPPRRLEVGTRFDF